MIVLIKSKGLTSKRDFSKLNFVSNVDMLALCFETFLAKPANSSTLFGFSLKSLN
jgi:hypothetical protein